MGFVTARSKIRKEKRHKKKTNYRIKETVLAQKGFSLIRGSKESYFFTISLIYDNFFMLDFLLFHKYNQNFCYFC